MSLERLTYASTATGSTGSLLNLAAILAESHRNNLRDGLTGVLAAHRHRYVQVILSAWGNAFSTGAWTPYQTDLQRPETT